VAEAIDRCALILERDRTELDVRAAGVNHFTWFLSIRDARDGTDLLPDFQRRWQKSGEAGDPLARHVFGAFGVAPAIDDDHIGEYLPWGADLIGTTGYDFDRHERRAVAAAEQLDAWAAGRRAVGPLLSSPSADAQVDLSAAGIIADIVAGRTRRRPSFILPNKGRPHGALIDGLPSAAVVEVPGLVDRDGPNGVAVGSLPEPIETLVRHELAIQDLAVEAARQGSRELALRALLLDPIVNSARAAGSFLDDVLRLHRELLPRFWS
jgi:alpha-galactosidase